MMSEREKNKYSMHTCSDNWCIMRQYLNDFYDQFIWILQINVNVVSTLKSLKLIKTRAYSVHGFLQISNTVETCVAFSNLNLIFTHAYSFKSLSPLSPQHQCNFFSDHNFIPSRWGVEHTDIVDKVWHSPLSVQPCICYCRQLRTFSLKIQEAPTYLIPPSDYIYM